MTINSKILRHEKNIEELNAWRTSSPATRAGILRSSRTDTVFAFAPPASAPPRPPTETLSMTGAWVIAEVRTLGASREAPHARHTNASLHHAQRSCATRRWNSEVVPRRQIPICVDICMQASCFHLILKRPQRYKSKLPPFPILLVRI